MPRNDGTDGITKADKARARLIGVATRLFREHGSDEVPVRRIAEDIAHEFMDLLTRGRQAGGAIRKAFEELKIQVSTKPVSVGSRLSSLMAPARHIQFRISCWPASSTSVPE